MKLLVNEDLIPLLPSLAMNVGLNAALFLQQLHDWIKELPFWPLNTIKRITYDLKQKGYLISTSKHNKMKIDNTKWYRIDYEMPPSSYKQCKIPANPIVDAASSQHETTVTPQLDAVSTHIETGAYPTMGRPITKELKNIKNKPIVEKNLDVAHSVIQYFNDKTGKQFKPKSAATRKFINGRIKEGYTQEDFIRVIDKDRAVVKLS